LEEPGNEEISTQRRKGAKAQKGEEGSVLLSLLFLLAFLRLRAFAPLR
jgi:hypothetical protein